MLRNNILAFARRYDFEEGHALQDERLALGLFDEAARLGLHKLTALPESPLLKSAEDAQDAGILPRVILSCAALLHDIGYIEGYERHHKTAFRLILAEPIPGLAPHAQRLVAHVARYHRGSLPDPARQAAFAALAPAEQTLVCQLGAILRFADGLDRSHTHAVQDLHCELAGEQLTVTLLPGVGDAAERWAGQKKARWFASVFGVKIVLQ